MGQPLGEWQRELEQHVNNWGTPEFFRSEFPNATVEELQEMARRLRLSASPATYRQLESMNMSIDVRQVLPAIAAPTLVLHRREDHLPTEGARWMASQIPGARFVEHPGGPHLPQAGDWRAVVDEVEAFLTDAFAGGAWVAPEPERVLATILFTDIVGSTEKVAQLGDRRWRELLQQHHTLVRRQLARYRGLEMDTAGDGFFARFDGPARAICCARAITEEVPSLGLEVRAGLHSGECELAEGGKITGIAVSIGARIAAEAAPGEVLVSNTVRDLVAGSDLSFDDRGTYSLKGVPGEWRLYAVSASA